MKNQGSVYEPDTRRTPSNVILLPKQVIAVDPGDAHVGVAVWRKGTDLKASEVDADKWLALFAKLVHSVDVVVIEEFRLYPSKAKAQAWSPMATAEMIGAMKFITSQAGKPVVLQGADIKIPTRRQCKARGLRWKDNKSGHASDALLHLQYYLLRHELLEGV